MILQYSYSLFVPTIIRALGYTATIAQLFTVPPNLAAFFLVLVSAGFSDRLRARGPFMLGGCLLAIIGYAMLIAAKRPAVSYGGKFLWLQESSQVSKNHPANGRIGPSDE